MYRKHIAVEDQQVFPLAGKVLNEQQLAKIGKEMADRRGLARS
jgi:hemerythrin-like domain-containing protein